MAVLVIAGSWRGAGKTAVGCALLSALVRAMPELRWLAVKLSPHRHEIETVWEESDRDSEKDTGRYLAAGAQRSFLVSGVEGVEAAGQILEVRLRDTDCGSLLLESNRLAAADMAESGEPSVTLAVLAGLADEWKASLADRVAWVDALVLTGGLKRDWLPAELRCRQCFELAAGEWISPEMLEFVRERLLIS